MQVLKVPVNERSTCVVTVPFLDEAGAPLAAVVVSTLTATLRDVASGTLIRTAQNVKNANGGVLTDGLLTLTLGGADTAIVGTALSLEQRLLTVDLVALGGARLTEEILFAVRAMQDITT